MAALPSTRERFPTVIVIFGATGDLTARKLGPGLFHLFRKDLLPPLLHVIGFSRRPLNDAKFREHLRTALTSHGNGERHAATVEQFLSHVTYEQGDFETLADYERIAVKLGRIDGEWKACANKLFYLAVPPRYYQSICRHLAKSGLTEPCSPEEGWTRVIVEKPFGHDLATAQELDALLGKLFREEQIFRVDHYLAKDTLRNILTFRFTNTIFDPVWNRTYVDRVDIRILETLDVGTRGAFYDGLGALRDVGQNHLLQMLALVAMENPGTLESTSIRRKRAEVLKAVRLDRRTPMNVVRAQYDGYRTTPKVAADSGTETYIRLHANVDNARWRGVPFILESGKALDRMESTITVTFKEPQPCVCPMPAGHTGHLHNHITFTLEPEERIAIRFWANELGLHHRVEPRDFRFAYGSDDGARAEAYEKLLYDAIRGDQTLFTSTEEVLASWNFIATVLDHWDTAPLQYYARGSQGPTHPLSPTHANETDH
ncbi:MAG: glucose-6-phosphate dehydrogenase [Candidatus Kerfeldbacteria bacterium]|nr:glucose-6-phosphate dehydrogenase [Candidatus Kerfeldbacteria bacterium]